MPSPLPLKIAGTGRFVPARVLNNAHFESYLDTSNEWIMERTGIRERHVVSDGESTLTLAEGAARAALADAGLEPKALDLIILATSTGDFIFPPTAGCLVNKLGIQGTPSFDLSATCSGFIFALVTGAHMLQSGAYRRVLVIGAESMSRVTDYEDRGSCILFGDGAGAMVIESGGDANGPCMLHHRIASCGSGTELLWIPAGGTRRPANAMTVSERLHFLKMQGREVFKSAVVTLRQTIETTLAEAGYKPDDLALVLTHQSNLRIIESARAKLGLPPEKMYVNIDRFGNTSAASVPIALDEVRKAGRVKSGDLVMMAAFGAGFTWGAALLRL